MITVLRSRSYYRLRASESTSGNYAWIISGAISTSGFHYVSFSCCYHILSICSSERSYWYCSTSRSRANPSIYIWRNNVRYVKIGEIK